MKKAKFKGGDSQKPKNKRIVIITTDRDHETTIENLIGRIAATETGIQKQKDALDAQLQVIKDELTEAQKL